MSIGYRTGDHELRAGLDAQIAYSRTPAIEDFIKSKDVFAFDADYLYHALEWLGPYVRFAVDTTMLQGYDERAGETNWSITRADGTVDSALGRRLQLTDPFQPLTLTEMAGVFARPYKSDGFTLEARTGFGGLHTLADGQLGLADDDATPEVEVKTLHSFDQAAVEIGLALYGAFFENKITWRLAGDVAIPVVNRPATPEHNIAYYTTIDLSATLSFKLLEWLSLDYSFKALRRPQLIDEFQITNNLLLTVSYTWSDENTGSAGEEAAAAAAEAEAAAAAAEAEAASADAAAAAGDADAAAAASADAAASSAAASAASADAAVSADAADAAAAAAAAASAAD
jgi:hypothetical protein